MLLVMSTPPDQGTITRLLDEQRRGNTDAREEIVRIVYDELRAIARARFGSNPLIDLQPTAVVHDAFARMLDQNELDAEDRKHLFFLLARKMMDVFCDHIRSVKAAKRGGDWKRVPLVELQSDDDVLRADAFGLHEALEGLSKADPASHQVVMLRFFGGRTLDEVCELTGRTLYEVRTDWDYARSWLREALASTC